MWKPWTWSRSSNDRAIDNARASATELGRLRVQRQDVELFLDRHRELHIIGSVSVRRRA